jgi:hypothetical protein
MPISVPVSIPTNAVVQIADKCPIRTWLGCEVVQ